MAGCWKTISTIPLGPSLARKGVEIIPKGYPQTPGKWAAPLSTPRISLAYQTLTPVSLQGDPSELRRIPCASSN